MYSLLPKIFNQIDTQYYHPYTANLYIKYDLIRNKQYKTVKAPDVSLDQIIQYDTVRAVSYDGFRDSIIIIQRVMTNELLNLSPKLQNNEYIEVRPCPNPYIFGGIGLAFDKLSLDLIRLRCADCSSLILDQIKGAGINIDYPVNFHLGVGLEMPITKDFDLTADLSYRSFSFGERLYFGNYIIPANKRLNALVFRIGLNF